jgi:hypothetical protein
LETDALMATLKQVFLVALSAAPFQLSRLFRRNDETFTALTGSL